MDFSDYKKPVGMKPYTLEDLAEGAKYYKTYSISDFWTDEEAEEYLQTLIDKECRVSRFRSIDAPWESS